MTTQLTFLDHGEDIFPNFGSPQILVHACSTTHERKLRYVSGVAAVEQCHLALRQNCKPELWFQTFICISLVFLRS